MMVDPDTGKQLSMRDCVGQAINYLLSGMSSAPGDLILQHVAYEVTRWRSTPEPEGAAILVPEEITVTTLMHAVCDVARRGAILVPEEITVTVVADILDDNDRLTHVPVRDKILRPH